MASKVGIPRGTRDFDSSQLAKRDYIFGIIKKHFRLYGYSPIETPSFENVDTLLGKYGEEGDRLIFRITESGDGLVKKKSPFTSYNIMELGKIDESHWLGLPENSTLDWQIIADSSGTTTMDIYKKILPEIVDKALRYDLTVPFARYVVQHRNEITLPFKRYQIQPVWRADKPQRGRYREFFQCDADVIGSDSLNNEVDLVQLMDTVFGELKIPVIIKINNRKILSGIAEVCGMPDKLIEITVAIDKLEKIGKEKVKEELRTNGLSDEAIKKIEPLFDFAGTNENKIELLSKYLSASEIGMKGIDELIFVLQTSGESVKHAVLELDVTLARGLNYYTGAIFEVKSAAGDLKVSICGGGRYDNLAGVFGWEGISGVGISFGADRIYDVLEDLNLFPENSLVKTKVLLINFGGDEEMYARKLANELRNNDVSCELYPDKAKMDKQMKYANNKQIEFVIIAGSNEIAGGKVTLKNMVTGEQKLLSREEILRSM